jgi:RimJ/RimL family protein N-acetyltransferase
MTNLANLHFRSMTAADLPRLREWLGRPHVRRWWDEHETFENVARHCLPRIEGEDPTRLFVIELDARSVGFIQTYLLSDHPEWEEEAETEPGVAGVDLFIAEPELTGQGLGTEVLRRFTDEIVFAEESTIACVGDPDVENAASITAFEKAGFRRAGEFFEKGDGRPHLLMRRDRG